MFAVALVGGVAAATLRHLSRDAGNPLVYLRNSFSPALMTVEVVGRPDSLRQLAVGYLSSLGKLSAAAQAKALNERFSCLEPISVRRDWLRRRAVLALSLRPAIAAAHVKGQPFGYLSRDGALFSAPAGLYDVSAPRVEASGASAADLAAAARLIELGGKAGALPAPLKSLRLVSAQEGWEATLADGTVVLWGDGRWTADKLARLREVLADARGQTDGSASYTADLRYFEDGKVLLRPLASRTFSVR